MDMPEDTPDAIGPAALRWCRPERKNDFISAHPAEKPEGTRKERNPTNGTEHQQQQ
jgi:hypothetical protein